MLYENIKKLRKKNNMSQEELAEKLGVSRQSVSLWETGQTQPTIDNIIALAKIFNTSTDEILGNTATEAPKQEDHPEKKKTPIWPFIALMIAAAALIVTGILIMRNSRESGKNTRIDDQSTGLQTDISRDPKTLSPYDSFEPDVTTESIASESLVQTEPVMTKPVTTEPVITEQVTTPPVTTKKAESFDLFEYCKEFAIKIGRVNGDYVIYQQPSTKYGGYEGEYFSITYWGDSDMVEFCLHCPLSETFSINFYLKMRGGFNHKYEWSSSRYYRDTGESLRFAWGYLDPAKFSAKRPLSCSEYIGSTDGQDDFMEESRVGICDLIKCLKKFVKVEKMTCGFSAFEFKNF